MSMRIHFQIWLIQSLILLSSLASAQEEIILLHNGWKFRQVDTEMWNPAKVPGTVHTDLLSAEIIEDPFYHRNEKDVQWIEKEDWEYKTVFDLTKDALQKDKIELVFEGLDTYADVYVNRIRVMTSDNMHRSWSASVKSVLKPGRNEIRVHFHSTVKTGQKKLNGSPYLIPASNEPAEIGKQTSVFTRKAQYHYGWDWSPRLVTSGIWRPVYLRLWDWARITDAYFHQETQSDAEATFTAEVEIESGYAQKGTLELFVDGIRTTALAEVDLKKGINIFHLPFSINHPDLWWPNGLGNQKLYKMNVTLTRQNTVISNHSESVGVRTIELKSASDSVGAEFYFEVNGEPVFMKGANVVPADFFNPRAAEKYPEVIQNAADAHMNMIRVWGGGVYENSDFYALCDQNGILVWQDFMFSIMMIQNDQAHLENIRLEAEENVKRLRDHASIAIWCGNNENLNGWFNWGWQETYSLSKADSLDLWNTYEKVFHKMLPDIVEKLDSGTAYWSSSPSSAFGTLETETSGDRHDWSVWFGQKPISQYDQNSGRFFSEYGMQSLPLYSTIQSMDSTRVFWRDTTSALAFRQRSAMPWIEPNFDGFDMITFYVNELFENTNDFKSFVSLSQFVQAEALTNAIESHRRKKPVTMGSLYWQLNDVWPTVSWSSVDYSGRWKPAHFAVRESFKNVIVSLWADEDSLRVSSISDLLTPITGTFIFSVKTMDGSQIHRKTIEITIPKNSNRIIFEVNMDSLCLGYSKDSVFAEASLINSQGVIDRGILTFVPLKDAAFSNPEFTVRVKQIHNRFEIRIQSQKLAKYVTVAVEGVEGKFSENYFDLPPGREHVVTFHPKNPISDISDNIQIHSLFDATHP